MTQTTKRALSASLKKLLSQKTLDKITVGDIAEDCGVNRQTFYYHFKDVYDLLEWTFLNEAKKVLQDRKSYATWQDGFLHVLNSLAENKQFVLNTYHSVSREYLERYLYSETFGLLLAVIDELAEGLPVREDNKNFIANLYKYAFVGLTLEWIGSGMKQIPQNLVTQLSQVIHGDIAAALERCAINKGP